MRRIRTYLFRELLPACIVRGVIIPYSVLVRPVSRHSADVTLGDCDAPPRHTLLRFLALAIAQMRLLSGLVLLVLLPSVGFVDPDANLLFVMATVLSTFQVPSPHVLGRILMSRRHKTR